MRRSVLRLWNAVRPTRAEDDLAREIASHLQLLEDEFVRRGVSADEAPLAARRALGSAAVAMDRRRDSRSFVWLDDLRCDLGYAARLLRRNPVFALPAVISLAIRIAANTTVFTIGNALLLRPPAGVADPPTLIDVSRAEEGRSFPSHFTSAYPCYRDLQQPTTTLAGIYAYRLDVLEQEHPVDDRGTRLRVERLTSVPGALATVAAGFFGMLLALMSIAPVIASANIAGVLLARAAARRREMAVRAAIDPFTFQAAIALLAAAGLAACFMPCRRAVAIDAIDALRCE